MKNQERVPARGVGRGPRDLLGVPGGTAVEAGKGRERNSRLNCVEKGWHGQLATKRSFFRRTPDAVSKGREPARGK